MLELLSSNKCTTQIMAPLEIHLSGESIISRHAERAVLSVEVSSEGISRETVSHDVTSTSNELIKMFKEIAPKSEDGKARPDAPVTIFSMTSSQTSTWVPTTSRNGETVQLPREFRASTSFTVIFRDFKKLGEVTGTLFKMPHTTIESTKYILTDQTKKDLRSESRKAALHDAIQKAQDYAEVLGKSAVVVEIKDQGYSSGGRTMQTARRASYSQSASFVDGLSVEPEDVELKSSVNVKFTAE